MQVIGVRQEGGDSRTRFILELRATGRLVDPTQRVGLGKRSLESLVLASELPLDIRRQFSLQRSASIRARNSGANGRLNGPMLPFTCVQRHGLRPARFNCRRSLGLCCSKAAHARHSERPLHRRHHRAASGRCWPNPGTHRTCPATAGSEMASGQRRVHPRSTCGPRVRGAHGPHTGRTPGEARTPPGWPLSRRHDAVAGRTAPSPLIRGARRRGIHRVGTTWRV